MMRCDTQEQAEYMLKHVLKKLKPHPDPKQVVNERIRYARDVLKPRIDNKLPLDAQQKQYLEDFYNGYVFDRFSKRGPNRGM